MEKKILRLLIVDDSPDDAEVASAALRKAGFMLKTQRVQDLASMQAALDKSAWDVVLSELSLPHLGALLVLELLKRLNLDIPCIVLTRQIKDTELEKIMRAGACDVVIKNQPVRIPLVVERELKACEERRAYRAVLKRLQELEAKSRAIIDGTHEAICYCQDGMHLDANKAYLDIFGYGSLDELQGVPVMNLIDKNDRPRFKEYLRKAGTGSVPQTQEFLAVRRDDTRFPAELTVSTITVNGERCVQIVASDISKRKAVESRLQYLNRHDPLTGLLNRHHFLQELNKAVERARQSGATSGLIYIDLLQLKEINDTLGHATGDRILLKVARLMREKLGEEAVLARFGGDEFTILLRDVDEAGLKSISDGLQAALKQAAYSEGGKTFTCGCSYGVALIDRDAESAQKLLSRAYQASQRQGTADQAKSPAASTKQSAGAPAAQQPPAGATASPAGNEWAARLRAALDKNDFQLAYQPIINLHGDPAEYFEVLVRLSGPGGDSIPASAFMPAAEQANLAAAIDRWVTGEAIRALAELHRQDRRASFFVNICAAVLKDPDFLIAVQKQLREAGVKPRYLIFEADESALTAYPAEADAFLKAARKIGCCFAIDNFGHNLNTLELVRQLSVDFVKIAGAHIHNLSSDPVTQTSLKALVQVAKAIDKKVIAKSVEKAEDLAILWNLGIDYVQGNYFQGADNQPDYEFASETTLSSDTAAPNWASGGNGR